MFALTPVPPHDAYLSLGVMSNEHKPMRENKVRNGKGRGKGGGYLLVRAFSRFIFCSYLQVIISLGLVPCDHQWGIKRFVGIPHSAATAKYDYLDATRAV
jgi:hypothetical protein